MDKQTKRLFLFSFRLIPVFIVVKSNQTVSAAVRTEMPAFSVETFVFPQQVLHALNNIIIVLWISKQKDYFFCFLLARYLGAMVGGDKATLWRKSKSSYYCVSVSKVKNVKPAFYSHDFNVFSHLDFCSLVHQQIMEVPLHCFLAEKFRAESR